MSTKNIIFFAIISIITISIIILVVGLGIAGYVISFKKDVSATDVELMRHSLSLLNINSTGVIYKISHNTYRIDTDREHSMIVHILNNNNNNNKNNDSEIKSASTCCTYGASQRILPINSAFAINTYNSPPGAVTAIMNAISTWEEVIVDRSMFGSHTTYSSSDRGSSNIINNNINEIVFGAIPFEGYESVLAVTVTEYYRNEITEWDCWINNAQYNYADLILYHVAGSYDTETVVVHELGHAVALGDLYNTGCRNVVMYGVIASGSIRRELTNYDKQCFINLYAPSLGNLFINSAYKKNTFL